MTSTPDNAFLEVGVNLLVDWGPIILSGVGTILAAIFSAAIALMRYGWVRHQRKMNELNETVQKLSRYIGGVYKEMKKEHEAVRGTLSEIRLQSNHRDSRMETVSQNLVEVVGAQRQMAQMMNQYVEESALIKGKLDAVFRFMDAAREVRGY
jgi:rubrerythrin